MKTVLRLLVLLFIVCSCETIPDINEVQMDTSEESSSTDSNNSEYKRRRIVGNS